jgi:hypothetical protein
MASFLSKIAGIFSEGGSRGAAKVSGDPIEYRGFYILPTPVKDGGQWRIAGQITSTDTNDERIHHFIRSDLLGSVEDATTLTIRKGQLIIDQMGARVLDDPGVKASG